MSEVLRQKLLMQQRREALSDGGMGERLSLHQVHWTRVRNGVSGLGAKGIDGAAVAYPDLVVEAIREVQQAGESADGAGAGSCELAGVAR